MRIRRIAVYRANGAHQQSSFASDLDLLSKKSRARLDESWSGAFYTHYFCRVSENLFAPLYSKVGSRPNIPVNVLVALEAIKSGFNWSDEELHDAFVFDIQVRYAVGYRNLNEGDFDLRTIYNFRHRLLAHQVETGEDLIDKAFGDITDKQMKAFRLKSGRLRVDSSQVSSNIRQMSRLQLLVEVVQRVHRMLSEADRASYAEAFAPYLKGTSGHFIYRVKGEEARSHVLGLGTLMQRLVVELATLYGEHPTYKILCRVFQEQYRVVKGAAPANPESGSEGITIAPLSEPLDVALVSQTIRDADGPVELTNGDDTAIETEPDPSDGAHQPVALIASIELRPGEEVSASRLRSPDDPDATYRRKGDRTYEGYATTITETCDPENSLQLIVKVQTASNTKEDAAFLRDALPELKRRTEVHTVYTDAGFCGHTVDELLRDLHLIQVPTGLRGKPPRPDHLSLADFQHHLDADGRPANVTCPHGHTVSVEIRKTEGRYIARLPECCRPTVNTATLCGQKNGVVLRFSQGDVDTAIRRQRCRAYHEEGRNLRSAIEATIGAIKRGFDNDKLPVRGTARMNMMLIGSAAMVNIRRIQRCCTAYRKTQTRNGRNDDGHSLLPALQSCLAYLKGAFRFICRPRTLAI
jgi:hypothetical protein